MAQLAVAVFANRTLAKTGNASGKSNQRRHFSRFQEGTFGRATASDHAEKVESCGRVEVKHLLPS